MKKKLFLLAVFVIVMCCITAVSAADDNMTEIALEDATDDMPLDSSIDDVIADEDEKIDAEMNVSVPDNMLAGETYTINITMPENADDWVDVYYDEEDYCFADTYLNEGVGSIDFYPMEMGNHTLRLHYYGNEIYNSKDYYIPFEVRDYTLKLGTEIVEYEKNLYFPVIVPHNFNGNVTVTINGKDYEVTFEEYKGYEFKVDGDDLQLGDNDVNIYFKGDERFHEINVSRTLNMFNRSYVEIDVSVPDSIIACEYFEFNVTLSKEINTALPMYYYDEWDEDDDWSVLDVEIVDGKGSASYCFNSLGSQTYILRYSGDDDYRPASKIVTFNVDDYTFNCIDSVVYDPYFEFDIWVPSGFYANINVTINNRTYLLPSEDWGYCIYCPDFVFGDNEVNIYYGGDEYYHELNVTRTVNVCSEIRLDYGEFAEGSDVYIYLNLPEDASGNLVAYNDGELLNSSKMENGYANIPLSSLRCGNYTVFAKYEDDDKYNANATLKFIVYPQIEVSKFVQKDDDASITVHADGGNLTVYEVKYNSQGEEILTEIGFSEVKDGIAEVILNNVTESKELKITYAGGDFTYSVYRNVIVVEIEISIKNNSAVASFQSRFSVYIYPLDGCDVKFYFDDEYIGEYYIDDSSSEIYLDGRNMSKGNHSIEIALGNASKKITFTVVPANITAPDYILRGDDSMLTVELPEEFEGNVTVYSGWYDYDYFINEGEYCSVALQDGRADIPLGDLCEEWIKVSYDDEKLKFDEIRRIHIYNIDISIQNNSFVENYTSDFSVDIGEYCGYFYYLFDDESKGRYYYDFFPSTINFDDGDLSYGSHTIEIKLDIEDALLSKKVTFYVLDFNATFPKYAIKGEDSNITFEIGEELAGNVTAYYRINDGDDDYVQFGFATLVNGQANISLADLDYGIKSIKLVYDNGQFSFTENGQVNVLDLDTSIKNNTEVKNDISSFNVNFRTYYNDDLIFKFDGDEKQVYSSIDSYSLSVPLGGCDLSDGKHFIELILCGDGGSLSKMIEFNTTRVLITIPQTISKNYNTKGIPSHASLDVDYGAEGNVTVLADGTQFYFGNIFGPLNIDLSSLDMGIHKVEIIYSGDGLYPKTAREANVSVQYIPAIVNYYPTYGIDDLQFYVSSTENLIVRIDGNETDYVIGENNLVTVSKSGLDIGRHRLTVEDGEIMLNDTFRVRGVITYNSQKDEISLILPEDANGTLAVEFYKYNETSGVFDVICSAEIPLADGKAIYEIDLIPDYSFIRAEYVDGNYGVYDAQFENYDSYKLKLDKSEMYVNESATLTLKTVENRGELHVTINRDGNNVNETVIPVENNIAKLVLSNLKYGEYSLYTDYVLDGSYYWIPSYSLRVLRYGVDWDAKTADINREETAYINATLPGDATGKVSLILDGKADKVIEANATISIPLDDLTVGAHVIELKYSGDEKYLPNSTLTAIIVNEIKSDSSINATADEINEGETATVNVNVTEGATGIVLVDVDGIKTYSELSGNEASVSIDNLKAGNYEAIVVYYGDERYNNSTTTVNVIVNDKKDSVIAINEPAFVIGEAASVSATVNGVDVKDIIYIINGIEGSSIAKVEATAYTVSALFVGNATHKANSTTRTFTVDKLSSEIGDVNVDSVIVGVESVIVVSMNGTDAGFVIVEINGVNYTADINGGKASLSVALDETSSGKVYYPGDDKFKAAEAKEFTAVVNDKKDSVIVINDPELVLCKYATVNATVNGKNAEGIVYTINGIETSEIYYVEATNYVITASFAGNATHKANATTKTFTVNKICSNINLSVIDAKVGETAKIFFEVTDGAYGYVIVNVNDKGYVLYTDDEVLEVTLNEAGEYRILAYYLGDEVYDSSNYANAVLNITEKAPANLKVEVPKDIAAGDDLKITVSSDSDGEIVVLIDGVAQKVENGTVTLKPTAGSHIIEAVQAQNADYNADAVSKTFVADKKTSDAKVDIGDIEVGKDTEISVDIPEATGNVSVIVDGVENVIPLKDGKANFNVSGLAFGNHSIVVVYSGDDAHDAAYVAKSISSTTKSSEFADITVTGDGVISAVLVDQAGSPVRNANLTYTVNGIAFNASTDADGVVSINASSNSVVELKYDGNNTILPSDAKITLKDIASQRTATEIKAEDYTTYAIDFYAGERGGFFKVKLVDEKASPLANMPVKIGFNGVVYDVVTNASGWAQLQINLMYAGTYTFAVAFLGDNDYGASFVVQKIIVNKKKTSISAAAKSYKTSAKKKSYTVTLKADKGSSIDGKAYMKSGKKVTMKINGKTYTANTNAKGQATFNLKITKRGKFAATVSYAGDSTCMASSKSVKITIK